jgi:ATP-dependent DNA helicase RecG
MVQEILEENKNGQAIFDFKDIFTFKVMVMSADPKVENGTDDTENGIDNGADGADNGADGADNGAEKLTQREREIILLIKEDNSISRKAIAERLNMGTTTVYRYIDSLKVKGILERIGGDRGGYWKIKK